MNEKPDKREKQRGLPLLISIILVFCVLGTIVYAVSRKISTKMSEAAIQNLSESLDLIQSTIEAIMRSQAQYQVLIARGAGEQEDPEAYICTFEKSQMMAKLSLIPSGKTEGVSSSGETFTEDGLDFSAGGTVEGLPVSRSYVNYMGTWSYTMKCPVEREGEEIGTLYIEYIYDMIDQFLPNRFYNKQATLYIMDTESQRFVLKPKGMGERDAGHLNLKDFYQANSIEDPEIQSEVEECLGSSQDILFYHNIRGKRALTYMWSVNDGTIYLVGYVPITAIQHEGQTVNQYIFILVISMLTAFLICILLYYLNWRQQEKIRRERESERKLHNRQLAEALRAAQIASESKTTFLSNMSHDIRTPMNAVLGFTTLLAADAENPVKVREYTKKILASGQHLLSLINDILDVSKIESGKVVLNYEKLDLNDIVSSVETIIQPMARAKSQEFHVEVTGIRHEYLVGDETRINQVLINLLSNAVKYTAEGGRIWLRIIGLQQRSGQYERIRIEVEDNGYGMTPEYLEKIFDAFTRAENSTTNKVQGTGLGMAITKSIVELMGGTIEVFSEVGRGSLFRVELELRILEGQTDKVFWEKRGISRIITICADPESRRDIQALMEDTGVHMEIAASAEEGQERLKGRDEGCQLALLDWESGGIDCLRKMRKALAASVPIVLLAEFDAKGLEEALNITGTSILTKPFFISAFQEKVAQMWADSEEPGDLGPVTARDLTGMHFLAAEDNEINAEILTELLDMEGATCEIVENGRLAVERFRQAAEDEFDAILMDVQMPVMNGHDAAKAIRALPRNDAGRIPIIAMTANAFAEDEKAALDSGMDAHVSKPLDMEMLKKALADRMKRDAEKKEFLS
ncbi:MAG: response regulator [Lachnospiraceae bacterium]|nr:response regulator [Lachnospiraceae bacterium]